MINILLCEQTKHWLDNFNSKIPDSLNLVATVSTGKEVQKILTSDSLDIDINVVVINLETKDYSFLEVVKFIKQNRPKIMIIMLANEENLINDYFYSVKDISKIGVSEYFIKPFPIFNLFKLIEDSFYHESWKANSVVNESQHGVEVEVKDSDHKFTSIKVTEIHLSSVAIFDLFVRISKNNYIKVFHVSEKMDVSRLDRYLSKESDLRLYFKTKDRLTYVNFMNELVRKNLEKTKVISATAVSKIASYSNVLIEEIYTGGLPPQVVSEATELCSNVYESVMRIVELKSILNEFIMDNPKEESHLFLTCFYCVISCKHIDWATEHSIKNILMGALLHDIGKIKLGKSLRDDDISTFSNEQLREYQKHPEYGVELLDKIKGISEQVKQIVFQHHELNTGNGFPNKLTSLKIYPLAKIISFCNYLANKSLKHRKPPLETIRFEIEKQDDIMQYEPFVIKAFIKGFMNSNG